MEFEQITEYDTLPLKVIRGDAAEEDGQIYLVMKGTGPERQPIVLGTGRNAVVFLGNSTKNLRSKQQEYYAIKFLKDDHDVEYARVAEERFFAEADNTQSFGQLSSSFVKYNSGGAILDESKWGDRREHWEKHLTDRIYKQVNIGDEYSSILESYFLQGPFYAVELCQGTLYDLLERDVPWDQLPVYNMQPPRAPDLPTWQDALEKTRTIRSMHLTDVIDKYIGKDIYGKSGYDILNSFKDDDISNSIRNYAVLDLFRRIVRVVRDLHSHNRKLVHRDLKPGNLFLKHDADFDGIGLVDVKLGDLGFTAEHNQLNSPNFTLNQGIRNPAAQTPGSQFYRAPEQAELPVEVRVSFEKAAPDRVYVHGSKISNIQVGDYLVIGDPFKKGVHRRAADRREPTDQLAPPNTVFKICDVEKDANKQLVFKLDSGLTIDNNEDIWANIVRATGYHTDGYTLGAILYDLVSGGRNPEAFYTYCLVRFIEEFSHHPYSIDDIVQALAPSKPFLEHSAASLPPDPGSPALQAQPESSSWKLKPVVDPQLEIKLSLYERVRLAAQLLGAKSVEKVVQVLLRSSLDQQVSHAARNSSVQPGQQISFADKWDIIKGIIGADYVDQLLDAILQSPIDIKMRLLGADILASRAADLSIEEKWNILSIVTKSNKAQDLIKDLLLRSLLDQAIARNSYEDASSPDTMMGLQKKWDYLKIVIQSSDLENMIEKIVDSAHSHVGPDKIHEWLRNYRFRTFHLVSELLTDKRGVSIPSDIIRIIVKCMLRNVVRDNDQSYYRSISGLGFLSADNVSAVHQIYHDTQNCIASSRNQPPDDFPTDLKENLLFNLRSMVSWHNSPRKPQQ